MQTRKLSAKKFHKISLNSDNLEAESQLAREVHCFPRSMHPRKQDWGQPTHPDRRSVEGPQCIFLLRLNDRTLVVERSS